MDTSHRPLLSFRSLEFCLLCSTLIKWSLMTLILNFCGPLILFLFCRHMSGIQIPTKYCTRLPGITFFNDTTYFRIDKNEYFNIDCNYQHFFLLLLELRGGFCSRRFFERGKNFDPPTAR